MLTRVGGVQMSQQKLPQIIHPPTVRVRILRDCNFDNLIKINALPPLLAETGSRQLRLRLLAPTGDLFAPHPCSLCLE